MRWPSRPSVCTRRRSSSGAIGGTRSNRSSGRRCAGSPGSTRTESSKPSATSHPPSTRATTVVKLPRPNGLEPHNEHSGEPGRVQCGRQLADADVYYGWCGHADCARGAPMAARPQPARPAADLPSSLAYEAPRPRTAGGRWVADLVANRFSIFGLICGVTALCVVPDRVWPSWPDSRCDRYVQERREGGRRPHSHWTRHGRRPHRCRLVAVNGIDDLWRGCDGRFSPRCSRVGGGGRLVAPQLGTRTSSRRETTARPRRGSRADPLAKASSRARRPRQSWDPSTRCFAG